MGTDTIDDATDVDDSAVTSQQEPAATWSKVNAGVILLFVVLTAVGVLLSVGLFGPLVQIEQGGSGTAGMTVPPYVYLYAGLGALGYVFTKLMVEFDRYDEWHDAEALASMLMRLPAALILAAGVYLLFGGLGQPAGVGAGNIATGASGRPDATGTSGARFLAGLSFLVGLYVNVAVKSLGGLADRIMGAPRREAD